jgi:hypothetical protein
MSLKKFLVMVENDVAGEIVFDDSFDFNKKFYDSLTDGGRIIEVDPSVIIGRGYIYDGNNFNAPE